MESHLDHAQEVATPFFEELREALALLPDHRAAYQLLGGTFLRLLDARTAFAGIRFNGPFAKTDYLLKAFHADRSLCQAVNATRVRLRNLDTLTDDELTDNFAHDLKAICRFTALVCQATVPEVLSATFPKEHDQQHTTLHATCLRVIVNGWDDTYITANADTPGADEVRVFYGGKSRHAVYKDWDWSYLRPLLTVGCQLNVVRPREEDGILYPELLIWEPDYLVDISAVAACFEEYAVSPLNHLLNKLKPAPDTPAILLGQLAGQLLDESLSNGKEQLPYAESVRRFFKRHALTLLTTAVDRGFHAQAQSQRNIIDATLHQKLPNLLHADGLRFDSSGMMVEPSFFSELLGLQGRMDFLGLDFNVLIEQKAGKAQFPETDPPHQQQRHYVQLLLYMLLIRYNYRETYERNGHQLFAFLFYSKYHDGLLPLGFAPTLMFDALRIRNEITAAEYRYSRGGLDMLATLTADRLNINKVKGPLWERYQKPQLEALLAPIRQASALERAYFLRFLRFLETEHLMAKVGSLVKENSGFADKWYSTTAEKLQTGNILHALELVSPAADDTQAVEQLTLRHTQSHDRETCNFRPGDIVIVYSYAADTEPDARRTMVFRASIERLTHDGVILTLRAPQANAHVFWHQGQRLWAVEPDFLESSFSSLYRGLHAFLSAPKQRRDLLLLQRPPRIDTTRTKLHGDYGDFNELVLRTRQACDLFLIVGPPGTGKTSFGLLNTVREELAAGDGPILLLAYTNRAVDEICGKLADSAIDFIRIGGRQTCEERYRPFLLDSIVDGCATVEQLRHVVTEARVVVGTTTSLTAHLNLLRLKAFSLAVIDEASQILEPHIAGLLSATTADGRCCAIRRMVLIGDHKQLPAVVRQRAEESAVEDDRLRAVHLTDCRLSLFERLLRQYGKDPAVTYMLTRQGRMHHDIARFPNTAFYQDRLREVPLSHQTRQLSATGRGRDGIEDLLLTRRIAFVHIDAPAKTVSDKVNSHEAEAIAATLVRIYRLRQTHFSPTETVGVIVPYRSQIAEVRRHIARYDIPALLDITIDTVERFQGSQRDFILYGFTVRRSYQLDFLTSHVFMEDGYRIDRKLNVAMTRARECLLLFGNSPLLSSDPTFEQLIAFVRRQSGYLSIPLPDYVEGRFSSPSDTPATR